MAKPGRSRIVSVDADVAFAFAPRVAVAVWRKDVTLVHLSAFATELRAFLPSCEGRGYASITVIEPTISLRMADDVRAASEKLQRELAPNIRCMAYLVQAQGFVAAAARTIASGFVLITRAPYPLKVFGTTDECATWASGHVALDAVEVERMVNEARAA
jgi:hypothetical protein